MSQPQLIGQEEHQEIQNQGIQHTNEIIYTQQQTQSDKSQNDKTSIKNHELLKEEDSSEQNRNQDEQNSQGKVIRQKTKEDTHNFMHQKSGDINVHSLKDITMLNHQDRQINRFKEDSLQYRSYKFLRTQFFRWALILATLVEIAAYLMHDYSYRMDGEKRDSIEINRVADVFELATNIVFTIEIVLIFLAFGTTSRTRRQLFTILNVMLTIVLISRILTIFRLFPEFAKKVNAFFGSFKHLGKTFFPLICVIVFYAVIGISFFRGHTESRCRLTPHPEHDSDIWEVDESVELPCGSKSCPAESYCGNPAEYGLPENHHEFDNESMLWGFVNFNDIFNALFSVYQFLMINGWVATTNIFWRAQEKTVSAVYFVSLVLLLSQIFSNIVLATLYEGFMDTNSGQQSKQEGGDSAVHLDKDGKEDKSSPEHKNTIFRNNKKKATKFAKQIQESGNDENHLKKKGMFQMLLLSQISNIRGDESIQNKRCTLSSFFSLLSIYLKKFRKSDFFSVLIFFNIIAIVVVLCYDSISINEQKYVELNKADFALTMIFFGLSFIELLSMGFKKYFGDGMLIIDFLIILVHIISYIVEGSNGDDIFYPQDQYYIFVRWTKILRLLRLFNDFKIFGSLKILMRTYYQTLKSLPEFLFLWVLLIVLFAQIGREILAGRDGGDHTEEETEEMIRINYNNLQNSLIAVIMICFNEEWQLVMYKYRRIVGYKSVLFHLFTMLILQVLFVRLFIAIFINIFMKWLRENEILLYHSQTTIILQKIYNRSKEIFGKNNNQVKPVVGEMKTEKLKNKEESQLHYNKMSQQQSSMKELIQESQTIQVQQQQISGSQAYPTQKMGKSNSIEDINGFQVNNGLKKEQTLFMKRLKEKNKFANTQQKSNNVLSLAVISNDMQKSQEKTTTENIDFHHTQQMHNRNQSVDILKSSTQASTNRIGRSKSNDNIVQSKSQISQTQEGGVQSLANINNTASINQFMHQKNIPSSASTANNMVLINNCTMDKSINIEEEEFIKANGNSNTNSNQKSNNLYLFTPQKSQSSSNQNGQIVLSNGTHNQDDDFNMNAQNNHHNENNACENRKMQPQHSQFPSISIQSAENNLLLNNPAKGNKNPNTQGLTLSKFPSTDRMHQDMQLFSPTPIYEKLLIMSSESLSNEQNSQRKPLNYSNGEDEGKNHSLSNGNNQNSHEKNKINTDNQIVDEEENQSKDRVSKSNNDENESLKIQNEQFSKMEKQGSAIGDIFNQELSEEDQEELSLFIFKKDNQIRKFCKSVVEHYLFDYFNMATIFTLMILLAIDTPFLDPNSDKKRNITIVYYILTIIFILDNILQIISRGFILSPTSYLRRSWFFNTLDLVTTIAAIFYLGNFWHRSVYYVKFILILRISVFLRFLSEQVKEVHHAGKILVKCLPRMIRLITFAVLFLLISAALTTKLLKGSMNHCYQGEQSDGEDIEMPHIITKYDCLDLGGDWIDSQFNFNNLINSLQILFMVQSSEGWIHIMFNVYDSTTPLLNSEYRETSLWVLFFIQFFFIANICMLNMFVGLVVETQLEMIESEHKTKDLHKFQKEWLFIKESIYQLKPTPKLKVPTDRIRNLLFKHLIDGITLKIVFYTFTLANCINLMIFKNRQPQDEIDKLYIVNEVCLVAMVIEVFCRLICLEKRYFKEPWNLIDIATVVIGWINLKMQQSNDFEIYHNSLRIFDGVAKGLQLLRFYRIMQHFTIVKKLFNSLQYAVSSIFGIFLVLIVFLFLSVLLSMNIFPFIKPQKIINGYDVTFKDFPNSLFNLIRVMTSEFWYVVAQEGAKKMQPNFVCFDNIYLYEDYQEYGQNACGSQVSYVFFYGFYLVFTLVILNIFIATIIESYKEAFSADESAVNHYQLNDVLELWKQYDPDGKGYISYKEFWQFSSQIAIIYGVKSEDLMDIQNKNEFLKTLNIPIFEDPINKIFCYKFHDVVVSISKVSVQIKYGITTLEPEDPVLRQQLESLIKKSKLSGDKLIKPTEFTSADMVLMIVLTRKVKQWKQKSINKETDFIFNIKQLTEKLRSQVNKSQVIELEKLKETNKQEEEAEEEERHSNSGQQHQEKENQEKLPDKHTINVEPQIKDILNEGRESEQFIPITVKSKLRGAERKSVSLKNSSLRGERTIEKNVKFVEDVYNKNSITEDCLIEQDDQVMQKQNTLSYEQNQQNLTAFLANDNSKTSSLENQSSKNPKNKQVMFELDQINNGSSSNKSTSLQQQSSSETPQEANKFLPKDKTVPQEIQSQQANVFSLPQELLEIKANSILEENEQREEDDYGMDVNFNNNFILAFDEDMEEQEEKAEGEEEEQAIQQDEKEEVQSYQLEIIQNFDDFDDFEGATTNENNRHNNNQK